MRWEEKLYVRSKVSATDFFLMQMKKKKKLVVQNYREAF